MILCVRGSCVRGSCVRVCFDACSDVCFCPCRLSKARMAINSPGPNLMLDGVDCDPFPCFVSVHTTTLQSAQGLLNSIVSDVFVVTRCSVLLSG